MMYSIPTLLTLKLLISLAFGNGWEMRHSDISVAFTNALPEKPPYVCFPKTMPFPSQVLKEEIMHYYFRNLYESKTAPKLWHKCLLECLTSLGLKMVAGYSCLFLRTMFWETNQYLLMIY